MRAVLVFVSIACVIPVARAQTEDAQSEEGELSPEEREARTAFEAGSRAFEEGRFEYALDRFSRAHELTERPALLYNVGLTLERLQRPEQALEALEGFLAAVPDSPNRGNVEGRIVALREAVQERRAMQQELDAARAARAAEEADSESESDRVMATPPAERAEPTRSKWWVWTLVGVLVVGAAVGVAVALTRDPGVENPLPGDEGVVVSTLSAW